MVQLDIEISTSTFDIVCLSETRTETQVVFVKDGHRLIAISPASGVAISIHRRWSTSIKRKICFHDRVMAVDLEVGQTIIRVIAAYLSHAG